MYMFPMYMFPMYMFPMYIFPMYAALTAALAPLTAHRRAAPSLALTVYTVPDIFTLYGFPYISIYY